ncbi:peptidoglycan DD-metalloendopeptidase family protein [Streptomyces sp. ML-6]|uniref:peptidoglycan DD-metalloendopeptidase family protein n=1 Tax=Streptomyces sp. ML-6 TaxID=2982693 RepID=UPI0024BFEB53|nr:peptidoglycan DD-metalloendopeptidase family protein [Streptomyces sp. ML-6]MDK0523588.1 transglycosylase family protein [Streptomyces sp. ML-6]
MAANGRHRKYQPSRINRASLTVTAGGAGLALPLLAAAPAGAASPDVWEKVAACESTGNWHINSGNGYFGGLQFTRSTWAAYGGTLYAPRADLATKDQQIKIAEKVLEGQGPGAWPGCSTKAGLTRDGDTADIAPQSQRTDQVRASEKQEQAADRKARAKRAAEAASPTSVPGKRESYTVARGDSLSAIAASEHVRGGWQRLYEANREVVGDDPDLIFPGQRLSIDPAARPRSTAQAPAAKPKAETPVRTKQPKAGAAEPEHRAAAPERQEARSHDRTTETGTKTRPVASQQDQATKAKPKTRPAAPQQQAAKPKPQQSQSRSTKPQQSTKPKPQPKKTESPRPKERPARHNGLVAPVSAGIGTPYHQAGSWSSGYHTGVDFPVPTGTSVKAVASGTVVSAGWGGAYGYQVVIRHNDGKYSQYAHLSALHVREGRQVSAGQRIARSGSTGNSTGPHLHFEIRTGPGYGSDIDPLAYLRAGGARV